MHKITSGGLQFAICTFKLENNWLDAMAIRELWVQLVSLRKAEDRSREDVQKSPPRGCERHPKRRARGREQDHDH